MSIRHSLPLILILCHYISILTNLLRYTFGEKMEVSKPILSHENKPGILVGFVVNYLHLKIPGILKSQH